MAAKRERKKKLSVRTNESSPFTRLSPTLMVAPMLRRLPCIIKAAQAYNGRNPSVSLLVCRCVPVLWTPPRETPSCVCHSNAHERKQAFQPPSCIRPCACTMTLDGGKILPGAVHVEHISVTYNHKLRWGKRRIES